MKKGNTFRTYVISIAIPLAVGGLSSLLTMGSMEQFEALEKPPLSPPSQVFPIVWTILFILMGIGAAIVWQNSDGNRRRDALFIYGAQLFVNFFWTIFFFRLQIRFFAFLWLLLLVVMVIVMIVRFHAIRPVAGYLQLPYLAWLLFAGYLNFALWLLNR